MDIDNNDNIEPIYDSQKIKYDSKITALGDITDKEKLGFAKQVLFYILMLLAILLIASFVPLHHDNAFIHLIQQILPVATLIIGNYFNK